MGKRNSRPRGRQRGYYDPGKNPLPRRNDHLVQDELDGKPTGASRQQRRQRARLSFVEQRTLAAAMGFAVPTPREMEHPKFLATDWVDLWEKRYRDQ